MTPTPSLNREYLLPPEPEHLYRLFDVERPSRSLTSLLRSAGGHVLSPALSTHGGSIDADLDGPTCRRLLDNFFNYTHVKNPILQESDTRRAVHHISMSGLDWSASSCLVLLICALGATATPFGSSQTVAPGTTAYALGEAYFNAARKRLGSCLIDGGVLGAQCLFLAGVYLMGIFQPYDAWRLFSQALACCQSFEFDTPPSDPDGSPAVLNQSPEEAAKQSIYWSAWKSEQESRAAFEMRDFPSSSSNGPDNLYPFFFPTPPVASPGTGNMDDLQARESRGWYFYLTEISLKRLYQRIANEARGKTHEPGRSVYDDLANALPDKESEIQDWLLALPSPMSLDSDPTADDVCKFVLRGHLHNYYEMIYWPFVARYIFSDVQELVVVADIGCSSEDPLLRQLAEAGLCRHEERIRINAPGFAHRHHGTWGMIRSCTRSALVLLKAALVADGGARLTMPRGWLTAVREVTQLNEYWQGEVVDARHHLSILEQAIGLV